VGVLSALRENNKTIKRENDMVPRSAPEISVPFHLRFSTENANDRANNNATPRSLKVPPDLLSEDPSTIESNVAERIVLMCASPLFTGLTPGECNEIASCAFARTFARDEVLFMQGHAVRSIVLIQSGSVKLTQLSANGNEVILWMNRSGDAMGIQADSHSNSHTCSARAMEQCTALVWEYTRLQMLVARYPRLGENISHILVNRLQELEERFREIATQKVATRLALALSRLVKQVGKKTAEGTEVFLSREELAQLTGTTIFTISRILSKWAELGVVVPRREAVLVPDPECLGYIGREED
jgi:CRP-like cAMP-binding protein